MILYLIRVITMGVALTAVGIGVSNFGDPWAAFWTGIATVTVVGTVTDWAIKRWAK